MDERTTNEPWRTRDPEPSAPSVATLLDNRSSDRYVPTEVTCANCGADGSEFVWFQRIPVGDVDGDRPTEDRHFCGIVCLSWYVGEQFPDYDPEVGPVGIVYD